MSWLKICGNSAIVFSVNVYLDTFTMMFLLLRIPCIVMIVYDCFFIVNNY